MEKDVLTDSTDWSKKLLHTAIYKDISYNRRAIAQPPIHPFRTDVTTTSDAYPEWIAASWRLNPGTCSTPIAATKIESYRNYDDCTFRSGLVWTGHVDSLNASSTSTATFNIIYIAADCTGTIPDGLRLDDSFATAPRADLTCSNSRALVHNSAAGPISMFAARAQITANRLRRNIGLVSSHLNTTTGWSSVISGRDLLCSATNYPRKFKPGAGCSAIVKNSSLGTVTCRAVSSSPHLEIYDTAIDCREFIDGHSCLIPYLSATNGQFANAIAKTACRQGQSNGITLLEKSSIADANEDATSHSNTFSATDTVLCFYAIASGTSTNDTLINSLTSKTTCETTCPATTIRLNFGTRPSFGSASKLNQALEKTFCAGRATPRTPRNFDNLKACGLQGLRSRKAAISCLRALQNTCPINFECNLTLLVVPVLTAYSAAIA